MLERQKENSDAISFKDFNNNSRQLDIAYKNKREKQTERTERAAEIGFRILRLKWAVFIISILQIGILIKITIN